MKKQKNSIICLFNGVLSLILGIIPMMYQALTPVNGFRRSGDNMYEYTVSKMNVSVDLLKVLVVVGIILIIAAIIFKIVKHNETKQMQKLLMFIPLAVILLYSIINYIPIFEFQMMYN